MHRPDGQVLDVVAFWRGRKGSNPESVKLTQVALFDLAQFAEMGFFNTLLHNGYSDEYNDNLIFLI